MIAEVRLSRLAKMESDVIDLGTLKAANVVDTEVESVKVVLPGKINRAITLHGLRISPSARAVIEAAGGKIEE
ncbi:MULTISPECIES: uL15 family ribosomal protein [Candidatus Fukatsuia]|nr:uL15 family ribosomal protein [Candidatus Fukatsuia symbiotica]